MRKLYYAVLILFILPILCISAEDSRFLINSGHSGTVSDTDFSADGKLIFSGGDDGTVRVWNSSNAQLLYRLQISHLPIRRISASTSKPYIASIESDGINSVNLSVWNWETGERLFRQRLNEIPLFLKFSPQGNFIVYGRTEWESLVFLDAETGRQLPYLTEGFGIVSSVFISDSEKTILTYSPSGNLQYWDLSTSTMKQKVQTVTNLEDISFSASARYMTAYDGRNLVLVDLITGRKISSVSADKYICSSIDSKSDKLVYFRDSETDIIMNVSDFSGQRIDQPESYTLRNRTNPASVISVKGTVYTSYENGNICRNPINSADVSEFAANKLLKISGFSVSGETMAISAPGRLLRISSDFFIKNQSSSINPEVGSKVYSLEKDSSFGLSSMGDGDYLLWTSESSKAGRLVLFNSEDGPVRLISQLSAPLVSAEYTNGKILTLDKTGECRVIDPDTGETEFKYTAFGLRAVEFIEDNNIIAGRSSTSTLTTPLLHINTKTGETVPVEDSSLLVFDLDYDDISKKLYTLGFEERNGVIKTVLKEYTGRNHDKADTIIAFPGEDIGATFASDPHSSKIFTTLGFSGVKLLYWGGFTKLDNISGIPRDIRLFGNILISLNQDNSFTIWNPSNGNRIMDLFIFDDLSWAASLTDNKYYASEGAEKYISIYDGTSTKTLNKAKFRLKN